VLGIAPMPDLWPITSVHKNGTVVPCPFSTVAAIVPIVLVKFLP